MDSTLGAIGHYATRARSHAGRAEDQARRAKVLAAESLSALPADCALCAIIAAAVQKAEEAATEARAAARVADRIASILCSPEGFDIAMELAKLARTAEAKASRASSHIGQDLGVLRARFAAGICRRCNGTCQYLSQPLAGQSLLEDVAAGATPS